MLRTFIFDDSKSQWREEEQGLLLHDMCVILDEDKELIYLWSGSKNTKKRYQKGYIQLKELISTFSEMNFQIILAKKNFPVDIQKKIETMLESAKDEEGSTFLLSRLITIRVLFISLIGVIILPIISILNISTSLFWPISDSNLEVTKNMFTSWITISEILIILTIFFLAISLIIGLIEMENQVIVFSVVGLIICFGLVFYLNFDIYLFLFQTGSTLNNFFILRSDILLFISINFITILIFEIPNMYKFLTFLKTYRKFIF
jgi:hypothetical protein